MCTQHSTCNSANTAGSFKIAASGNAPQFSSFKAINSSDCNTVEAHSQGCCSSENNTSHTAGKHVHTGCCGSHHHVDNELPPTLNENDVSTYSWKVDGMDCPSCARKVETAVTKLAGVDEAKVLFATEKLVVKSTLLDISSQVEQAVMAVGFTLTSTKRLSKKNTQPLSTKDKLTQMAKENSELITISLMMLSGVVVGQFNPELSKWIYTLTCLFGVLPVGKKAVQLAKSGTPFAIETLMTVAALGALYLGETVEAAMVLLLFMLGERLEAYAASRARSGVQALMELVPESATKIVDGQRIEVAAEELKPKDIIEIAAGGRLPADGRLMTQAASFDESALTGESLPVERNKGEQVMAGSVVADQTVQVEITSKQGENAIDRILHLIEEAESRKAPLERFLDKFSRWYTPAMMLVSLLVIVTPPLLFAQPWETWVYRGLALLLIACPCALVISTPAAITSGLATAAKRGALIKGGAALEQLGRIETIAFDKTGTLTQGKPTVTDVMSFGAFDQEALLATVAAIEVGSSHPLAKSLVRHVESLGVVIPDAESKRTLVGAGMEGIVEGKSYQILAPRHSTVSLEHSVEKQLLALEQQGKTAVVVIDSDEQKLIGILAWQDTLREDAKNAVQKLNAMNIKSVMLTGDNPRSAKTMADSIGINFEAGLLPDDKVRFVEDMSKNSVVAMVGDGINDAPAMKASSIGIAMGSGTDVALEVADSALTHSRLVELPAMIELSRATLLNIRQNVALALGLKGVFLVTSLFGITGLWVAVLADSGATALVTLNALRLLRFKPEDE
ncbi:zinc/cadmium/mercury/lead-transporting ATPase [Vibrio maerlii]|uniref:zinc/cadmium/mercury/lead-transporting ATPase n=1 Tax=Vibrio maerlii TaxID=2231648 RepID=UPI000E3CEE3B|nr:zinc/cadmium/mercury/lead-transporting ATPase [Vibrio maerlii]